MRKLISLAVCLLGIGTSNAGLVVDRNPVKIHDDTRATFVSAASQLSLSDWRLPGGSNASSWRGSDLGGLTQLRRAGVGPLANYGAIKREYIKFSWSIDANGRGNTISTVATRAVPEPGALALLALGLIGIGVARRRHTR